MFSHQNRGTEILLSRLNRIFRGKGKRFFNEHISNNWSAQLHKICFSPFVEKTEDWGEVEKACQVGWEPPQRALPTTLHPSITTHWDTNSLCGFSLSSLPIWTNAVFFVCVFVIWAVAFSSSVVLPGQYAGIYSRKECVCVCVCVCVYMCVCV